MNMETLCPLPVDWLDWLEGDSDAAPAAHLDRCPACFALVEELRAQELTAEPLNAFRIENGRNWAESSPASPAPFEIWWTRPVELDASYPVRAILLLLERFEENGSVWLRTAPLSTDLESATPSEIRLDESESSLETALLVLLGHQSVIDSEALESRIGALLTTGERIAMASLDGVAPDDRYGPPLESENDPRLAAFAEESRIVRILGRRYEESEGSLAAAVQEHKESHEIRHPKASLRWRSDSSLALAAASSTSLSELEATLIHGERSVVGVFKSRPLHGGFLTFRVESSSIDYLVRIEIVSSSGEHYVSDEFEPRAGTEVRVAPASVFPKSIKSVELKSSDE